MRDICFLLYSTHSAAELLMNFSVLGSEKDDISLARASLADWNQDLKCTPERNVMSWSSLATLGFFFFSLAGPGGGASPSSLGLVDSAAFFCSSRSSSMGSSSSAFFGSFFALMMTLFLSASGLGSLPPSASSGTTSILPRIDLQYDAMTFCCGMEQWFSKERMMGYSDWRNAYSLMAVMTSLNLIWPVRVCPWKIMGSFLGPSQQSSSTQRQPLVRSLMYLLTLEYPLSWSLSQYVLWLLAHQ
mmetsp:Transcript_6322/g.13141  ORF Transcript_6322/g.13141 Transcript_6322/m.13141 type:complete len:244 (+) Transcript_6322:661-1392(+)